MKKPAMTTRSESQLRNKKRVVKLVISITLMFAFSWLPIQLILFVKSFTIYEVTIFNISIQVIEKEGNSVKR